MARSCVLLIMQNVQPFKVQRSQLQSEAADIGQRKITSIQSELRHNISPVTIANALEQGFKAIMKIQLATGKLTSYEKELSEKLYREKYATKKWTFCGIIP